MNILATLSFAPILILAAAASAQSPESFKQAKALASQSGKPILLEFYHDD
jgi:hypothetical protein